MTHFDQAVVDEKYLSERDKRLVTGRTETIDLRSAQFSRYRDDPFTQRAERVPVATDVDVVIVGGGIAGLLAGVALRKAGLERICIIDEAGGVGGTWYWNRYPGVMCDVESYIYMPMLEELGYVPTRKYAYGEEILSHLENIAVRYQLSRDALFHTSVRGAEWNESSARWRIRTDCNDELTSRYYVLAVGILNLQKIPSLSGLEDFEGHSFHTARWDYNYTGGAARESLSRLETKAVGLVGSGASGIQCVPALAESAKHLFVFQRTPSAIGERNNRPTEKNFGEGFAAGWQRARMDNFQALMMGQVTDLDLVDDGWTRHYAALQHPLLNKEVSNAAFRRHVEELDFAIMEWHRNRIAEDVSDLSTAEALKPYYRYLCKRPCFHDEYLQSFNRSNVTLVDCPSGIERVTSSGIVANGTKFDVDCIILGTGFEAERTPLPERTGHEIVGRAGISLEAKWSHGAQTLFGIMSSGFPNLFIMPAPAQQAVVTVNYTQLAVLGAEFIGRAVALFEQRGFDVVDVEDDAEVGWTQGIVDSFVDSSTFLSTCTPSRINNEGHPESLNPRNGNFGVGMGDWFAYRETLEHWLDAARYHGEFRGIKFAGR
jgi:cation diffusion facilitator CzcD-associated flavoprotein CzcO